MGASVAPSMHSTPRRGEDDAGRRRKALTIWGCRKPIIGTPGQAYLLRRDIKVTPGLEELGYVSDLAYWSNDNPPKLIGQFPALVAPFRNTASDITGVHMTFLDQAGRKASVEPVKKMRGFVGGSAVRFGGLAPEIALCEGLENALSVRQSTGLVAWAAGSLGGLKTVVVPEMVRKVFVVADPKPHERFGAEEAARKLIRMGIEAVIVYSAGDKDMNAMLTGSVEMDARPTNGTPGEEKIRESFAHARRPSEVEQQEREPGNGTSLTERVFAAEAIFEMAQAACNPLFDFREEAVILALAQLPELTAYAYREQGAKLLNVTTKTLDRAVAQRRRDCKARQKR